MTVDGKAIREMRATQKRVAPAAGGKTGGGS